MLKQILIKTKRFFSFVLCSTLLFLPMACTETVFLGSKSNGFKKCIECKISSDKAYEIAKPYLQLSYELRNKKRNYPPDKLKIDDYILLKGNYYYITRDNYPYKTYMAYLSHAVKVDSRTGKLFPPK